MYIKEGGRGGRSRRGAPIGGVQLGFPILVGVPFFFQKGREGRSRTRRRKEREREKEKGGHAPTPCPIRFGQGEARHLLALLPSLH